MDKDMNTDSNFWVGKKVLLEFVKDGHRLTYNYATIIQMDNFTVSFRDRDGMVFSFNKNLIQQMKLIEGD